MQLVSELQQYAVSYCINRGREVEKQLKEVVKKKEAVAQEEAKLKGEVEQIKAQYQEAITAYEKYKEHILAAKELKKKWGF